ncbi:MAG: uroporphyrinogen decarboxylase [delta proteobacterium ML8_F1]|nr:MAG: uroporphyrinogen decarboxylase [delta proteobacterium ML8_F1]
MANVMLEFQEKYDWDFMKINTRAVYYHQVWGNQYDFENYNDVVPTLIKNSVNSAVDLDNITVMPGNSEPFEEQLEALRLIKAGAREDYPILMTIFTPIGILMNLCGERSIGRYRDSPRDKSFLFELIENNPVKVHQALENITETLIDFVGRVMDEGADGLFYAALGMARDGFFTLEEWEAYAKPYDVKILQTIKDKIVLLHTCGIYGNPERFVDYPINAIHWAQSADGCPPIDGSDKWIGDKLPMGGIDERVFGTNHPEIIKKLSKQTLMANRGIPFIFTPDCSVSINTTHEELMVFRQSVGDCNE